VFPDAVAYILDSSHLKENIYQFAEFLYPEDKINQKRWATEIIDLVHEGNIDEAIERVTARIPDKLPDNIVNLSHYMNENKERMRYNEFKAKGYFIGSGSVESGHKVVVQQRMKQAGMRWSRDGAQYIAALRARYQSNMWDNVSELIAA
jgi:predicted transcriptional regulator